jgi:hypothetical protein
LPKLLSEAELSKLPEAPLMPFDPTARFEAKLIALATQRQQRALPKLAMQRKTIYLSISHSLELQERVRECVALGLWGFVVISSSWTRFSIN